MPCRLINDLHEWSNEISTVPWLNLMNFLLWCAGHRRPVGSEDPMNLYYSLMLRFSSHCIVYAGDVKAVFPETV